MRLHTRLTLLALCCLLSCISADAQGCADAFINELHYDNEGTDSGEAVEVVYPSSLAAADLSIVLYNGANGNSYSTKALSGGVSAGAGSGLSIAVATYPTDGIQNGSPDALALVCSGALVPGQALSYEGTFTAANGPANGVTFTDIGVAETSTTPVGFSLQLKGTGSKYADFAWADASASSFGAPNAGQTFTGAQSAPPAPPGASASLPPPAGGSAPPAPPPADVCAGAATPISSVQGSGASSPLVGNKVTVRGVVTGDFQGGNSVGLGGFFLQTRGDGDGNPATSEGVFVYEGATIITQVAVGDVVTVQGTVTEFNGLTQITATAVSICGTDTLPEPVDVTLPPASTKNMTLEPFEGMLVTIAGPLTVTNNYGLGRYGEFEVSADGRVYTGTQVAKPGAAAAAIDAAARIILVDDGKGAQNLDVPYPPPELSYVNTLRTGATTDRITGALTFSFDAWTIEPTVQPVFDLTANARSGLPAVGGRLRIASFNVLNYFNQGTGFNGGSSNDRGANTALEFERQRIKIINAIATISPDVVGLTEIENDGYGPSSAIQNLVDGLNNATAPGTYAFREVPGRNGNGIVGTDAISVKFLYQPATIRPLGPTAILDSTVDPTFIDTRNRPTLIQNWEEISSGGTFVYAINHLKSKGSGCGAGDDATDGSGNCAETRRKAAVALVNYLKQDPTKSNDTDIILMGDFNAYYMEAAMQALYDSNYTNLEGPRDWSYQFDGAFGSLDHGLASPSLFAQITGAHAWHLNADEPVVLDYNIEFKSAAQIASYYGSGPYRSSDHDPVVVGITLTSNGGAPPPLATPPPANPPPLATPPPANPPPLATPPPVVAKRPPPLVKRPPPVVAKRPPPLKKRPPPLKKRPPPKKGPKPCKTYKGKGHDKCKGKNDNKHGKHDHDCECEDEDDDHHGHHDDDDHHGHDDDDDDRHDHRNHGHYRRMMA